MWTEYRAGQIVPRRYAQATKRKAQHGVVFGDTCLVQGRRILKPDYGYAIVVGPHLGRRRDNGTLERSGLRVDNLHLMCLNGGAGDAWMPYGQWWLRQ